MMNQRRKLTLRLVCAVLAAFAASMALTWILHDFTTTRERLKLFDEVFADIGSAITDKVDRRMIRQAMLARDILGTMRNEPWWNDVEESSRRLRELANELGLDEVTVVDSSGLLTHSARPDEVGKLDFRKDTGQAHEFVRLLDGETEMAQPLMPNSMRGEMVKYVGVWLPEGGFVQVGGYEKSVRNLSRTAITGLTHDRHISGDEGGIFITTANGTIISHPEAGREGGQWTDPSDDYYWAKRIIEGFPVYIVMPKRTVIADRQLLVSISALLNGAALVFAAILVGIVIARYVRERIRERNAKDMAMAAGIQESAIPRVFPPFADERRMDIFASMHTAKDVGGDFYDFYFTSATKLSFLVADVSGKGVPAALFMMRAKATIKGIAQTGLPLGEVAERANEALSNDNEANMFVTAWIGEIDLANGMITYVNAGHNPPLLIRRAEGAGYCDPEYVRERSGMMFGAMPGMKYRAHQLKLNPGDIIYLYTDGITEQPDMKGVLFGEDRLQFSVKAMMEAGVKPVNRSSSPLLSALFDATIAHGAGAEQADDCTQLIIRYNGERQTGDFPAEQQGIAKASDWLDGVLSLFNHEKAGAALHVILDEICSNIVKHSGATGFKIVAEQLTNPMRIRLIISDDGTPYDPLSHVDPDTTLSAKDRPIGGLGILMVKKMAKSVTYRRIGNRNVLTVEYA